MKPNVPTPDRARAAAEEALPELARQRSDVDREGTHWHHRHAGRARTGPKGSEAVPGNIGARFSVDAVKTP